jgi:hypothetical protein
MRFPTIAQHVSDALNLLQSLPPLRRTPAVKTKLSNLSFCGFNFSKLGRLSLLPSPGDHFDDEFQSASASTSMLYNFTARTALNFIDCIMQIRIPPTI